MNYSFPIIRTIDDVLPYLDDNFMKIEKDGYIAFDYILSNSTTFPDLDNKMGEAYAAMRREFRGIIFDNNGQLIRRPFHKFFNYSERVETTFNLDLSDWVVMDKLDGSMVAPFIVGERLIWGTKVGETTFSKDVSDFIASQSIEYDEFARWTITQNITPIFEWISPNNRIVLKYDKPNLVLTALRRMDNGRYITNDYVEYMARAYSVPCVTEITYRDVADIYKAEDTEGVVLRNEQGHLLKIKADWYVRLHRTKDELRFEKDLLSLILNNQIDDLAPFMLDETKAKVYRYMDTMTTHMNSTAKRLCRYVMNWKDAGASRKEFAANVESIFADPEKGIVFTLWNDPTEANAKRAMINLISKYLSTQSRVEVIRPLIGTTKWEMY